MTDSTDYHRGPSTRAARDACLAAYRTAIADRIAACALCDGAGMRLDPAGESTRQRCTHPRRDR